MIEVKAALDRKVPSARETLFVAEAKLERAEHEALLAAREIEAIERRRRQIVADALCGNEKATSELDTLDARLDEERTRRERAELAVSYLEECIAAWRRTLRGHLRAERLGGGK